MALPLVFAGISAAAGVVSAGAGVGRLMNDQGGEKGAGEQQAMASGSGQDSSILSPELSNALGLGGGGSGAEGGGLMSGILGSLGLGGGGGITGGGGLGGGLGGITGGGSGSGDSGGII